MKKNNIFEAYIDSFNEKKILIDKAIYNSNKTFYIINDKEISS